MRGGGSSQTKMFLNFCVPKSICQNSDKISTFLVKTKNVPYGLKCKINPKKFSTKGFPKGGVGAGVSITHFISRTLLLKYSNFQQIYKKLGQFYKKLNFDKKYQIKKNNALLECLLACIPIIRCI